MKLVLLFAVFSIFLIHSSWQLPVVGEGEGDEVIASKEKRDFWSRLRDKVTDKVIDNIGKRSVTLEEESSADNLHKLEAGDKQGRKTLIVDNDIDEKQKRGWGSRLRDKVLGGIIG